MKKNSSKARWAKERGIASEEVVERCAKYLKSEGMISRYRRSKSNDRIDRLGVDFLFMLSRNALDATCKKRTFRLNVKSTFPTRNQFESYQRRGILVFVADRFNTTQTESERLLDVAITHVRQLQKAAESPRDNPPM